MLNLCRVYELNNWLRKPSNDFTQSNKQETQSKVNLLTMVKELLLTVLINGVMLMILFKTL